MPLDLCPVAAHSRRCPQGLALSWSGRSIAWDALNNYVHSTSRYLKEISVRAGAPVVVIKENSPAYVIVLLALWRIGAVPCPVDAVTFAGNTGVILAALKPALIIGPRGLRKTSGPKAGGARTADIEQVVAYGYNDSFLGSEASLDPMIDDEHQALFRLSFAQGRVEAKSLTHQDLKKDPGELGPLLDSLRTGTTYNI